MTRITAKACEFDVMLTLQPIEVVIETVRQNPKRHVVFGAPGLQSPGPRIEIDGRQEPVQLGLRQAKAGEQFDVVTPGVELSTSRQPGKSWFACWAKNARSCSGRMLESASLMRARDGWGSASSSALAVTRMPGVQ